MSAAGIGALGLLTMLCTAAHQLIVRRDPRRMRSGTLLLLAALLLLALVLALLGRPAPTALLLALWGLSMTGALVLGATVVIGSLVISPRDARPRGRVLSGLGGLALLASPVLVPALAGVGGPVGLVLAGIVGVLAMHLGIAFLIFLGAALPYLRRRPRLGGGGIIVLGSTLHAGRIPPLLRGRLERAAAERERLLALGVDPLLVPSGGKGDEDTPHEAEAMAAHLIDVLGVPADRVRTEIAARTTEENLILSHRLLDEAGQAGTYLVVTSGYHAFRAALIARELGFGDEVVGGPTGLRHLPTAMLREFVLLLGRRLPWVLAALPVTVAAAVLLVRML